MFPNKGRKNQKNFKKKFHKRKVLGKNIDRVRDSVYHGDNLSEEEKDTSQADKKEAEKVMKQREQNYRKFLIEQGKSAATKWDSFSEDEEEKAPREKKKSKKRKIEENPLPDPSNKKKQMITEPIEEKQKSPDKMDKIKSKLKEKYDKPGWNKNLKQVASSEPPKEAESSSQNSQKCLGCRKVGHRLKDCKEFSQKNQNICLKCGSPDHRYKFCPVHKGPKFNFATCFKCKEMGHLSSQCPQSASGIYPNGGSCNRCQSVEHLARDCPQNQRRGGRKHHTKDAKKYFRVNRKN
ncbi:hypothetical protein DMENIID0001_146640 [Sergentomyia squamirostris]